MAALAAAARLPSLPALSPMKFQECSLVRFSITFSDGVYKRRRRRRRRRGVHAGGKGDDAFELGGSAALEAEIFEFMRSSSNPRDFPTRAELEAAGRADLADAIAKYGGWLAFGWDLEEKDDAEDSRVSVERESWEGVFQDDSRISQQRFSNGYLMSDTMDLSDSEPSSSGRLMEMEDGEGLGIEGILSRLEKERSLAFTVGSMKKEVNGLSSWKSGKHGVGDIASISCKRIVGGSESRSTSLGTGGKFFKSPGGIYSQNRTSPDVNGMGSSMPNMWRTWSLRRSGFHLSDFEAAEIVHNEDENKTSHAFPDPVSCDHEKKTTHAFSCDVSVYDKIHRPTQNAKETGDEMNELQSDARKGSQNQIRKRLQHLESELTSALQSFRCRTEDALSDKVQKSSLVELHMLSDAWEFQETEIMNARHKVRSIQAELAVLEGKMMLATIEACKIMEEKQKKLDAAQNALHLLRTVHIVWPNAAAEVLLAGSFNGWTSQRRMERLTTGIFSLYLKLYPGRYEIKFIVDGAWRVDPLRPIVNNNGYENNILIVT